MTTAKRSRNHSFRVSLDLDARLVSAMAATGCNISELAQLCFGRCLDAVVRELLTTRAIAADEFLRTAAPTPAAPTPAAPTPAAPTPAAPTPAAPKSRRGKGGGGSSHVPPLYSMELPA
ncbi:hypothetical protein LBMAG56_36750 [Verrucomicrobiota bacterium]|nr:hypothetical protein LBMAG56_36750 [Verrucomicrobiota bacterium]